jgi:hypothetical protein
VTAGSTGGYLPISPQRLVEELAAYLASAPGIVRVAIDGAHCTGPEQLAASLMQPLQVLGRRAVHVRADHFWRDASLRLEYGHTDVESLLHDWLDIAALRRELLEPLSGDGSGEYLPSLRDPVSNRATRAARVQVQPGTILLLSGQFLLGQGLPFDRTVHLSASLATLHRCTPGQLSWTLEALQLYEQQADPAAFADVDIRVNDPRHPAIRGIKV